MLGVVMEATGRREAAIEAYERALRLFPSLVEARRGVTRLTR